MPITTVCLKKVPNTFKLSITLSNLNRFSKYLHCWKTYEICHIAHTTSTSPKACCYTTLGNSKFKISADIQQIWKKMQTNCIFNRLKLYEFCPILIANKIFRSHCSFDYFFFRSVCGTKNSSQQTSLQCLSTINMAFSDEYKILIKMLFAIIMGKDSLFYTPTMSKFVDE